MGGQGWLTHPIWPNTLYGCNLSYLLLVEVPLPQVSELTLFSLVTWPNTDTQFKREYSIPEQAGSVAPLLYRPYHFHCPRAGIPGRPGNATVTPALSSYTRLVFEAGLGSSLSAEGGSVRAGV